MRTEWLSKPWPLFAFTATFCLADPGSASIKALLLIGFWTYLVFQQKRFSLISLLWFASVLAAIAGASQIGFLASVPAGDVLNQGSRVLTMFVVLSIGLLLKGSEEVTPRRLDRLIGCVAV